MKKLWMAGAIVLSVAALFVLVPKVTATGATTSDFIIEGTTLVSYTGTATTVSVPTNVETIGRSAFEENDKLRKITISDNVTEIEEYAFWGCDNLETVILGKGLHEVADFAFTNCSNLKKVSIPDNIGRIGIMAFADCTGLEEIYIPLSVTDIHDTAFDNVPALRINAKEHSYAYRYALARAERLEGTESPLATPTPAPQQTLPTMTPAPTPEPTNRPIGEVVGSTTVVGNQAVVFIDNRDMEVIHGDDVKVGLQKEEEISDWTYYGDKALYKVEVPEGTKKLGEFSFARSNLKSIDLPDGLTTIGYAAFYHCDSLEEIYIPDTVTKIEAKALNFTPWLEGFLERTNEGFGKGDFLIVGDGVLLAYRGTAKEVIIPEGVKYIAAEAFLNHTEIKNVKLPSTLEVIDADAFEGCTYKPAY